MSRQLTAAINQLHAKNSLKAWSVIITFFGDSIAPRGGAVSAATVQTVMLSLGIGAGTVRTALSRLAKDGWVTRQKSGRNSYYKLSNTGKAPFSEAEAIIYATRTTTPRHNNTQCFIAIKHPTSTTANAIFQQAHNINKDCYLFTDLSSHQQQQLNKAQALVFPLDTNKIPDWITGQLAPAELADKYHQLIKIVSKLAKQPPRNPLLSLATRTLVIHEWRRLLLTSTSHYDELLPANWPHNHCLQAISDLYHVLSPAAEQWLDQQATGPDGPLLVSDFDTRNRFTTQAKAIGPSNRPK